MQATVPTAFSANGAAIAAMRLRSTRTPTQARPGPRGPAARLGFGSERAPLLASASQFQTNPAAAHHATRFAGRRIRIGGRALCESLSERNRLHTGGFQLRADVCAH